MASSELKRPAEQVVQEVEASMSVQEPLGHMAQVDSLGAPTEELNFPLAHAVQPLEELNFPSTQDVQVMEAAPEYLPASQEEHVDSLVVAVEELNLPAEQEIQLDSLEDPVDVLYFPAPHATQAALEAPPEGW